MTCVFFLMVLLFLSMLNKIQLKLYIVYWCSSHLLRKNLIETCTYIYIIPYIFIMILVHVNRKSAEEDSHGFPIREVPGLAVNLD